MPAYKGRHFSQKNRYEKTNKYISDAHDGIRSDAHRL